MDNIRTMMVALCILALLTTTIFLSMHVYVQGKFASLTKLKHWRQNTESRVSEVKNLSIACIVTDSNLTGNISNEIHFDRDPLTWDEIIQEHPDILPGGSYKPSCSTQHRVAIIIPLRNRDKHLRHLLAHMHTIWKRHAIDYTVYAITQSGTEPFNRGKLMNIGFTEANKDREYKCYVFQDVDLLLENDNCLYWCPNASNDNPNHLAGYVNKFNYKILKYSYPECYPTEFNKSESVMYFGGVTLLSREQFVKINGFSNIYWGWGGEDDDLYFRIRCKGYRITHKKPCRFSMIKHVLAEDISRFRMKLLWNSCLRQDKEGLNSLNYTVLRSDKKPLYTDITVDLGIPSVNFEKLSINSCQGKIEYSKLI